MGPSCSWGCHCDAVCSPPRRSHTTMAALHWQAAQHIIQVNATVPTWSIMYHNYWWCFTGCLLTLQSPPNPSCTTVTDCFTGCLYNTSFRLMLQSHLIHCIPQLLMVFHWMPVQHIIQVNTTVPPNPSHSTVTDGVSLDARTTHHSGYYYSPT